MGLELGAPYSVKVRVIILTPGDHRANTRRNAEKSGKVRRAGNGVEARVIQALIQCIPHNPLLNLSLVNSNFTYSKYYIFIHVYFS